jgi:hypothetical protein
MTDPRVFYADEDPWEIPTDSSTTPRVATLRGEFTELGYKPMLPYYLLTTLKHKVNTRRDFINRCLEGRGYNVINK